MEIASGAKQHVLAHVGTLVQLHHRGLLDARHAIGVTERARYIGRVRGLAKAVAESYFASREKLGFPRLSGAKSRVRI